MYAQTVPIILIAALASGITANWFVRRGNDSTEGFFGFYRAVFVPAVLGLDILAAFITLAMRTSPTTWGPALLGLGFGGIIGMISAFYRPLQKLHIN